MNSNRIVLTIDLILLSIIIFAIGTVLNIEHEVEIEPLTEYYDIDGPSDTPWAGKITIDPTWKSSVTPN